MEGDNSFHEEKLEANPSETTATTSIYVFNIWSIWLINNLIYRLCLPQFEFKFSRNKDYKNMQKKSLPLLHFRSNNCEIPSSCLMTNPSVAPPSDELPQSWLVGFLKTG